MSVLFTPNIIIILFEKSLNLVMAYNQKTSIPMPSYRSDHYGHSSYDHSGHSGHSGYGHDTGYSSHGYGYKEEDCPGIPVSLLMLTLGGLGKMIFK